jgi:ornithine cyclodeaminase
LFRAESLPSVVHVNAIGSYRHSMRELPDELLADATVVVDQREAALAEAGEIAHAIASGILDVDGLVELSDALARRPELADRTVFKSVGIAIQDWALGDLLAQQTFQNRWLSR